VSGKSSTPPSFYKKNKGLAKLLKNRCEISDEKNNTFAAK